MRVDIMYVLTKKQINFNLMFSDLDSMQLTYFCYEFNLKKKIRALYIILQITNKISLNNPNKYFVTEKVISNYIPIHVRYA